MALTVCLNTNAVLWRGRMVQLTPTEAEVLSILQDRFPRWVRTDSIMAGVYGMGETRLPKTITDFVATMNRKLREGLIPARAESGWFVGAGGGKYRLRLDA
jgi:DNA-binding response OmpR family regulator